MLRRFPSNVQFVGSIPLPTTSETMTKLATALPSHLLRLPDGEPGLRGTFSGWQKAVFLPSPYLMYASDLHGVALPDGAQLSAPPAGATIMLAPTHFDTEALKSYTLFVKLRDSGIIPKGVRFQVSMPTPMSMFTRWVRNELCEVVEEPYEASQANDLQRIQAQIPHQDLAIQWDAPIEIMMLEGIKGPQDRFAPWFGAEAEDGRRDVFAGIVERLARLGKRVAPDVQLGYHFCYGDIGHRHVVEPKDVGVMVKAANGVVDAVGRSVNWIHMPIPKDRTDDAYIEPLLELKIDKLVDFELSLGLIHPWDLDGTKKRIEVARRLAPVDFTIATECGLGRTNEEELDAVLEVCQQVMGIRISGP